MFKLLLMIELRAYNVSMSIRFVASLDETPQAPNFMDVGVKILFTTINGLVKPYELIEPTGEHIAFGIPVAV